MQRAAPGWEGITAASYRPRASGRIPAPPAGDQPPAQGIKDILSPAPASRSAPAPTATLAPEPARTHAAAGDCHHRGAEQPVQSARCLFELQCEVLQLKGRCSPILPSNRSRHQSWDQLHGVDLLGLDFGNPNLAGVLGGLPAQRILWPSPGAASTASFVLTRHHPAPAPQRPPSSPSPDRGPRSPPIPIRG